MVLRAWESDAADPPGHYYGFGSASASVSENALLDGVQISLHPVAEGPVEAAVTLPAAFASSTEMVASLWLSFARYEQFQLASYFTAPGRFTLVAPSVGEAETWVGVSAAAHGALSRQQRRVAVPSQGLSFQLAAPPELVEPVADAAIGSGTIFRWSRGAPGGSHSLSLSCESTRAHFITYLLESDGLEASLPAIPGLALVPGSSCTWGVLWCAAADPAEEKSCSWSPGRSAVAM